MAQKRYEIDSSLSSNIEIPTKYDDEAFDIDTWSYKQNQYASKYMTDSNNTTRIPKRQRVTQNKQVVKQSDSIVTIGTKSFADAFKQARNAGLDKFRWKGRVYGTRYASEVNNISTVQGNTNTSVRSNTSTKNNPSNTGTNTTTPRRASSSIDIPFMSRAKQAVSNGRTSTFNTNNNRTGGATVQRQTIQRLNFDNNENKNQLYYSTAALNNKINSMPTLRDNTTPTFYEARRRAQQLGQKSFTWRGNTYSTYGRTK